VFNKAEMKTHRCVLRAEDYSQAESSGARLPYAQWMTPMPSYQQEVNIDIVVEFHRAVAVGLLPSE